MRRDLRRVRHWIRGLILAAIAMLGLVALVGSGGGSFLPEPCLSPSCLPEAPTVSVEPAYVTVLVGVPVVFTFQTSHPNDARSYPWSRSDDGGPTYVEITGANRSSYSIAAVNLADDGAMFRVQVEGGGLWWRPAASQLAVSATPGLVFEELELQPEDWIVSPTVGPIGISPGHGEERADSGGHPGAFRKMVFTVVQPVDPHTGASVAYLSLSSTYEPAAHGAIRAIDHVEDCIALQPNGFGSMNTWSDLVMEQGGRTYVPDRELASCTLPTWSTTASQASLRAQDFRRLDGSACGSGEACPDFSASAPPSRFGYMRTVTGVVGDSITHGIDNWKVTVWRR